LHQFINPGGLYKYNTTGKLAHGPVFYWLTRKRVPVCNSRLTGEIRPTKRTGKIERSAEALRMNHHPILSLQSNSITMPNG